MNGADFVAKMQELNLPVVSVAMAANIMQKTPSYTKLYLSRLRKKGTLKYIERGRYCLPSVDDYTIASRIIPYSYITGYAALEHYRLTTQMTTKLEVVSFKYHRPLRLSEFTAEFIKVKREFIYGFIATRNGTVFAEPEKIFVDDLYLHGRQYYSEEFDYAMELERIDTGKLIEYAKMSGNKALAGKINALLAKAMPETRIIKHSKKRMHA